MLVASLQYLAAEFEERLLVPVARLEGRPVAALELLVDLYLDADLASPRKVSVWYAFWGEASSRQEYYDICGKKDDRFAALVRTLIQRLIEQTRQTQLDPDGIALGLIGVLEILWQGFAFQTEATIDRPEAKRRCMAYLRSIFPGEFSANPASAESRGELLAEDRRLPRWSYDDAGLAEIERSDLFSGTWQFVGHRRQLAQSGAYLAVDIGTERVLLVRDEAGAIRAMRDSCPQAPHRLSRGSEGRLTGVLECRAHGVQFALDGSRRPRSDGLDLPVMDLDFVGDLMFVRSSGVLATAPSGALRLGDWQDLPLRQLAASAEAEVAADWKVVVEQWLGSALPEGPSDAGALSSAPRSTWSQARLSVMDPSQVIDWSAMLSPEGAAWSAARYRRLAAQFGAHDSGQLLWRRLFLPPNQLIETRPDGVSILQTLPNGAGNSRVRRCEFSIIESARAARALQYLGLRLAPALRRQSLALAQSVQQGIVSYGYAPADPTQTGRAQAHFAPGCAAVFRRCATIGGRPVGSNSLYLCALPVGCAPGR